MRPLSVVVVQNNASLAESLAQSLNLHFRAVKKAPDLHVLRELMVSDHADVAIVDLEIAGLEEVRLLKQEFARCTIVCTHRLADEKLWSEALTAGAADCCFSSDVRAIVLAATQVKLASHSHAA
jgi:DNA-binding NarL/FixJ family response regulator